MRTRNRKVFKSNFIFMHRNSSFLGENVFLSNIIVLSIRGCCLYHFNVTEPQNEKGDSSMKQVQISKRFISITDTIPYFEC